VKRYKKAILIRKRMISSLLEDYERFNINNDFVLKSIELQETLSIKNTKSK
jgi:hypothetical protein